MSDHGVDSTRTVHPLQPRHQITRSVTETNTSKLHRHHHLLSRRHQDRHTDRTPPPTVPYLQMPLRGSLELPRSEGVTPYVLSSAEQSRRTSMLPSSAEDVGALALGEVASGETRLLARNEQAIQRRKYETNRTSRPYCCTNLASQWPQEVPFGTDHFLTGDDTATG